VSSDRELYGLSVFINCPFSIEYQPLFRAILFSVYACGYRPRSALEVSDSSANRLSKIEAIIRQSRFGIHDISFMHLDARTKLPRFNMPFELGLFLGAKSFGSRRQRRKLALILDRSTYRYRAALSDISGHDIAPHNQVSTRAIREIRNWLNSSQQGDRPLPGGEYISSRYKVFTRQLPAASERLRLNVDQLTYADVCRAIEAWLKDNA
jgi:hypothetical protein